MQPEIPGPMLVSAHRRGTDAVSAYDMTAALCVQEDQMTATTS